jgi:hypothetical protein
MVLHVRYKQELDDAFGIVFNNLFTITNMPIKRFADFLYRRGELNEYMALLVRNFNSGLHVYVSRPIQLDSCSFTP